MGLVRKEDANIQRYVTGKSLDGLYLMIGEEEKKKIRQDRSVPAAPCSKRFLAHLRVAQSTSRARQLVRRADHRVVAGLKLDHTGRRPRPARHRPRTGVHDTGRMASMVASGGACS